VNLARALEVSSNIGISVAVWKFYKGHESDFFGDLNKMSFGQPDFIDGIEGLKPTTYDSPQNSDWVNKFIIWSAIGYNRKIAPIQMLTFYNAIANDGKMVKPTLKTGEIEIINPQIASKDNIKKMQVILEHVVSQGLGRKAGTPILRVAGKTGTSQVNEYDYYNEVGTPLAEYQLAFCGYFPAEAPKYSIIVSMNKLGLPASGGGMAGVVFSEIVEWMICHDMPTVLVVDEEKNDTTKLTEKMIK
jgi:cell division protein FtsI (penicillin-binding protein 3)